MKFRFFIGGWILLSGINKLVLALNLKNISNNWISVLVISILLIIIGSAIIGLGIAMEVWADLTYMPGDGLVKVIYEVSKLNFGVVKVTFDVTLVVMAMLITYFGLGEIFGQCVREGTLISALTVGVFADMFLKLMKYKKQ